MGKATIKVNKYFKTARNGGKSNLKGKRGQNKCPVCGKFMGNGGKQNG